MPMKKVNDVHKIANGTIPEYGGWKFMAANIIMI